MFLVRISQGISSTVSHFRSSTLLTPILNNPSGYTRTFFSTFALGMDPYIKKRQTTRRQFRGTTDRFWNDMRDLAKDSPSLILSRHVRLMLNLVDSPENLNFICEVLRKRVVLQMLSGGSKKSLGIDLMKACHLLNEPTQALQIVKDPGLSDLVAHSTDYKILMDLLYRNEMYQEILNLFETIPDKRSDMVGLCLSVYVVKSCWKLNTRESYDTALRIREAIMVAGKKSHQTTSYTAALALNQQEPQVALDILWSCRQSGSATVQNLLILVLAELNRPQDSFELLQGRKRGPNLKRLTFPICRDVLQKLALSVDRLGKEEVSLEFQRIVAVLEESGRISFQTLEEVLERGSNIETFNASASSVHPRVIATATR